MKRPAPSGGFRARAATGLLALCFGLLPCAPARAYSSDYPQPDESSLDNHGHYVNRDGNSVHAPAHSRSGAVPQGATARCGDGSYSFSRHHRGTCSRHGGVASWL